MTPTLQRNPEKQQGEPDRGPGPHLPPGEVADEDQLQGPDPQPLRVHGDPVELVDVVREQVDDVADRVGGDGSSAHAQRLSVHEGAARDPDGHPDALELQKVPVVDEAEYEPHRNVAAAVKYGVRLHKNSQVLLLANLEHETNYGRAKNIM